MIGSSTTVPATVIEYIRNFEQPVRGLLEQMRKTIRAAAPKADEGIGYQMPAYKYYGALVYFAGYKNHIGFYPGAAGIARFKKELSVYKGAKGSVQFPIDKPLPLGLITKMVKSRVKENETAQAAKKTEAKKKKTE